jgi:hypothetical protein
MKMNSLISPEVKKTNLIIPIFLLSCLLAFIGANHFWEDTLSTFHGIQALESTYDFNLTSHPMTYWTLSLFLQVNQIVFGIIYASDRKKRFALGIAVFSFVVDFYADAWYRTNGHFWNSWPQGIVGSLLTLTSFTFGSEIALTFGWSLIIETFPPALVLMLVGISHGIKNRENKRAAGKWKPELPKSNWLDTISVPKPNLSTSKYPGTIGRQG